MRGAKGFATPFSTAFNLRGQALMRCSGLLHHIHLLVPTQHSEAIWLVLPYFHRALLDLQDDTWEDREQASSDLPSN